MASSIVGPTLTDLARQTNSSLDQISLLFTLKSLGFLLGSFVVGRTYDRVRGHPIMFVAIVGMVVMLFLIPLIGELIFLISTMLVMGLAMGSLDVGGNTLLVWVHREKIGPYMNGLHFIWGVGGVVTPLILVGLAAIASQNVRWTYWIVAIFLIPIAVWLLQIASPTAPVTESEAQGSSAQPLFITLVAVFFFLYIGAEVSTSGWIVTYAAETGLATKTHAAYLSSIFFAALTLTRLIMIPIAVRYRPTQILIVDLIICLISASAMVAMPLSWVVILGGVIGLGIGMSSLFPMMLAFVQNRAPLTGKTNSWIFLGGSTGGMSVPWLVGQLFESVSPQVVLYAILLCTLASGLVFVVIKAGWERVD